MSRAGEERRSEDTATNIYCVVGVGSPLVKIGKSVCPPARLKSLQAGSPVELRIAYEAPAPEWLEREVHVALESHRVRLEWFRVSLDLAMSTIELCRKRGPTQPSLRLVEAVVVMTDRMVFSDWYSASRHRSIDELSLISGLSRPLIIRALKGRYISRPKAIILAGSTEGAVDPRDLVFPDLAK